MTIRSMKKIPMGATMPAIEADELHRDDVDAFIARNRDVLNESIEISREEVARGTYSRRTVDDIIAAGMKRHSSDG
jgi:hypothetical protein